jgi:hypothetical protein
LLGAVFECLFTPDDSAVPTVYAIATERRDERAAEDATSEALKELGIEPIPLVVRASTIPARLYGRFKYRGGSDTPPGPTDESTLNFWFEPPRRGRIDRIWRHDGVSEHLACVATGFRATGAEHSKTYDFKRACWLRRPWGWAPADNDLVRLFWPPQLRQIVVGLSFDHPQEDMVAGRRVVRVRARERPEEHLWPQWLIWGADEYVLAFDLQFGHLLVVEGYRRDRLLGSVEVTSVEYGGTIDETTFAVG